MLLFYIGKFNVIHVQLCLNCSNLTVYLHVSTVLLVYAITAWKILLIFSSTVHFITPKVCLLKIVSQDLQNLNLKHCCLETKP